MKKLMLIVVVLVMLVGCSGKVDVQKTSNAAADTPVIVFDTVTSVPEDKDSEVKNQAPTEILESEYAGTSLPSSEESENIEGDELEKVTKILDLTNVVVTGARTSSTEYLEYGDKVEYCYRSPVKVYISMKDSQAVDSVWKDYPLDLTPPQYRAFLKVTRDSYCENCTVEVDFLGDEIKSVNKVFNSSGDVVWYAGMTLPPRELNALELAYLEYRSVFYGLDPNTILDLDADEGCDDIFQRKGFGGILYTDYSLLELEAMDIAFAKYVRTNPNVVFISTDLPYVVIDGFGNILKRNFVDQNNPGSLSYYETLNNTPLRIQSTKSWKDVVSFDPSIYWYVDVEYFGTHLIGKRCTSTHFSQDDCYPKMITELPELSWATLVNMAPYFTEDEILEYFNAALEDFEEYR